VRKFLLGEDYQQDGTADPAMQSAVRQQRMSEASSRGSMRFGPTAFEETQPMLGLGATQNVINVGSAHAILTNRPFNAGDKCVQSSFDDYLKNECWICTGGHEEWDMWLSCRHMFCKDCSTNMLSRRMPCPLCRVSSSVVKRGTCARGGRIEPLL
ncbi:unnamed protein product, partial [Polarella glacialis]